MSKAASLVSAHLHIHGVLAASRPECISEHLQLLFLMSLRRMKTLVHEQLKHLWVVFQGTPELLRRGAGKWLGELVELFEADLQTMESIMVSWQPPAQEVGETSPIAAPPRPGPPLPPHNPRESDGVALSTVEVLRREAFDEWDDRKTLWRALIRYVLPRDGHVADFCARGGAAPTFLNDTGLMTAYGFDASPNIRLLSKGIVEHATLGVGELNLWRTFDIAICLTADADFGDNAEVWGRAWQHLEAHATRGAIVACGSGELRRLALRAAATHAPKLELDDQLTTQLESESVCVFWRRGTAA